MCNMQYSKWINNTFKTYHQPRNVRHTGHDQCFCSFNHQNFCRSMSWTDTVLCSEIGENFYKISKVELRFIFWVRKWWNGLTTHSKLIISLATSDILVTISVFAHLIIKMFNQPLNPLSTSSSERLSSSCQFAFVSSLNIMAHLISLFNLLMMAIDHYFAIMRQQTTKVPIINKVVTSVLEECSSSDCNIWIRFVILFTSQ
jgi:hypothetical protein